MKLFSRKKKLIIFGTGTFGQLVKYYVDHYVKDYVAYGFTESPTSPGIYKRLKNIPYCSFEIIEHVYPPQKYDMFIAVGYREMNSIREDMYYRAKSKGYNLPSFSFLTNPLPDNVKIGDNCFIFEDNTIQPFVEIGNNVILWSGNHIGHHSQIGDNTFISSHVVVSGNVKIGKNCFLGVNSTVIDGVHIGDNCLIGARSLITRNAYLDSVYINKGTRPDIRSSKEMNF
jgi:sugar O-acyltransferase (sialic acid O-acetyltransferase NeuD family)